MAVLGNRSLAYEPFVQDETVWQMYRMACPIEADDLVAAIRRISLALAYSRNTALRIRR